MESQYTPLLLQKIIDSQAAPLPGLTRRDYATLQREVRALQDTRQQWPQAHCLLVAQQVSATVALPPDIELHRASHWLLEDGQ